MTSVARTIADDRVARADVAAIDAGKSGAKHVPALDGIRGLAILLVLFFHFAVVGGESSGIRLIQKTWGFGWIGVDLFFVLSGFLITGILLEARAKPHYFRNFYARRTVRIFPLYFAFLAVVLLILPRVTPNFSSLLGEPMRKWSYWLYVYNLFQGAHGPQFSHSLGVTWSLCIEEQFYLIWPAVVLLVPPQKLLRVCVGLICMSLIARLALVSAGVGEVPTSQWTFCRMDALASGACLAILMRATDLKRFRVAAILIAVLVPIATIALNKRGSLVLDPIYRVVGYTSLAAMFGSVLLLTVTGAPSSPLVRFFSHPFMRMLGKYSYAMYLFNQPVKYGLLEYVWDARTGPMVRGSGVPSQIGFFLLASLVTVGLAWVSWNIFEKHFLKLKMFFPMDKHVREQVAAQREAPVVPDDGNKRHRATRQSQPNMLARLFNRAVVTAGAIFAGTLLLMIVRELLPPRPTHLAKPDHSVADPSPRVPEISSQAANQ